MVKTLRYYWDKFQEEDTARFVLSSGWFNVILIRAVSRKNLSLGFLTRSNTNKVEQPQGMDRGLIFQILEIEELRKQRG